MYKLFDHNSTSLMIISNNNQGKKPTIFDCASFSIKTVSSETQATKVLAAKETDLIVIDSAFNHNQQLKLVKNFRPKTNLPIVVLMHGENHEDCIEVMLNGADDCLNSLSNKQVLHTKIHSLIRASKRTPMFNQSTNLKEKTFKFGTWTLQESNFNLVSNDGSHNHELAKTEYMILELLLKRNGRHVTREEFLDIISNDYEGPFDRIVDVYVCRLRNKLNAADKDNTYIKTVRGVGYHFCMPVQTEIEELKSKTLTMN